MATKKAIIIRDFNDAGTGASFVAGKTVDVDEGAFTNYEAAGLMRADDANAKPKADGKAA